MNKSSEIFKETIKNKLDEISQSDPLFAKSYSKPEKNIDECIKYILSTVQKSGINGFTDDEVYGMAMHYYDEDNLEVKGGSECQVIVNHTVQLTEEEKQEQRKKALDDVYKQERERITKKTPATPKEINNTQQNLFS